MTKTNLNDLDDDLARDLRENFAAKITTEYHQRGTDNRSLSITHNGYQWSRVALSLNEMLIVKELLSEELTKHTKSLIDNNQGVKLMRDSEDDEGID